MCNDFEATDRPICCKSLRPVISTKLTYPPEGYENFPTPDMELGIWFVDVSRPVKQICCNVQQMWIKITFSQARQWMYLFYSKTQNICASIHVYPINNVWTDKFSSNMV
jgi:hypothetical protein